MRAVDVVPSVLVVASAYVAFLAGSGWWSPVLGTLLIGFGPGYLLLRSASSTVPSRATRLALYVATSLAITAIIGLAVGFAGAALTYDTVALGHLTVATGLYVLQAFAPRRMPSLGTSTGLPHGRVDWVELGRSSIRAVALLLLPFALGVALLLTSPARGTEGPSLFLVPLDDSSGLPFMPLDGVKVVAQLSASPVSHTLEVRIDGELVRAWTIPAGVTHFERVIDREAFAGPDATRLDAQLVAGTAVRRVWLDLSARLPS